MSKVSYNEDFKYADSRLRGTVVKLKGKPFYVDSVHINGEVSGRVVSPNDENLFLENIPLKDLDLVPFKIGYVNLPNKSPCYLERIPSRFYKQGLTNKNVRFKKGIPFPITYPCIYNSVVGIFPSLYKCIDLVLNGECEEEAFDNEFSCCIKSPNYLSQGVVLMYKADYVIGSVDNKINHDNGVVNVRLNENFKFLKELVEEKFNNGK